MNNVMNPHLNGWELSFLFRSRKLTLSSAYGLFGPNPPRSNGAHDSDGRNRSPLCRRLDYQGHY